MSGERGLFDWPEKIKVNHLKRFISSLLIRLGLIHAGCLPPPHVGTDIVTRHRNIPKVIKSLTTVYHHPNGLQRHIAKTTMPHNVKIIFPIMALDLCISTGVDVKKASNSKPKGSIKISWK